MLRFHSPQALPSGAFLPYSSWWLVAMFLWLGSQFTATVTSAAILLLCCLSPSLAQTGDTFGNSEADPVRLFERGQNAHAHGELERALEFYELALKVRPEFPEAAFQKGTALVSLGRFPEAEASFKSAIGLRRNWSLPYSALAAMLVRNRRDQEAEPLLLEALKLDGSNTVALRALADLRLRAGYPREAVELTRRVTENKEATVSDWILRGIAERAAGDKAAARASLDRALQLEAESPVALEERAKLQEDEGNYERAIEDLQRAQGLRPNDKQIASRLVGLYEKMGKSAEALRLAESSGLTKLSGNQSAGAVVGTTEEIEAANSDDPAKARQALEKLLERNPKSALLLGRLGTSYRKDDPLRSLDFYRRAADIEPGNLDYPTGYATALVQVRRFEEAVAILRRVLGKAPANYVAHANLATALYELKLFAEALREYDWLVKSKPDLVVVYYFIATAHDYLGEYQEALPAYETFLMRADTKTNELEIEKVKLRLPSLRKQIKLGQGVKRKP